MVMMWCAWPLPAPHGAYTHMHEASRTLPPHPCNAGLLNLLYLRYSDCAGNAPGRALLGHMLAAAACPYCAVLEQWMTRGVLDDPYLEFMVVQAQVGWQAKRRGWQAKEGVREEVGRSGPLTTRGARMGGMNGRRRLQCLRLSQ